MLRTLTATRISPTTGPMPTPWADISLSDCKNAGKGQGTMQSKKAGENAAIVATIVSRMAVLLLAVLLRAPSANGAGVGERPLTIDDLLHLSDLGRAAAQPGNHTSRLGPLPPSDTPR